MIMSRVLAAVKPHIQMIKFRKNSLVPVTMKEPEVIEVKAKAEAPVPSTPSISWSATPISLEWWETPAKYKRSQIDQDECDIINSGGREKPWC
jgi:hypothetical protein